MRDDLNIPMPGGPQPGDGFGRVSYGTRQAGMDPNTRRMALIAGAIGGALLLVVGVWSMVGPRHGGVPVVQADARPLREKPLNKGGLNIIGANEQGLSADPDAKPVPAPAPEAPALAALQQAETPPAPPVLATPAAEPPKAEPVVPAPPAVAEARPGASAKPSAPIAEAPRRVAAAPPVRSPAAAPLVAPAAAPRPAVRPVAGGGRQVQLAAVTSQQAAQAEWQRLAHKFPSLLGHRRLEVSRFDHDGRVFWRVRTGGFADTASASAFCSEIRAKGAACEVPRA